MASKSKSRTLTDHDEIRQWAEERGAKPTAVRATHDAESTGIIRLDFPGYSGEGSLEEIEWDEWFEDFDNNNLALIVQDKTAGRERSNFNKLVSREDVDDRSAETSNVGKRSAKADASSKRTSARKTRGRTSGRSPKRKGSTREISKKTAGTRKPVSSRKSSGRHGSKSQSSRRRAA